MNQAGLQKNFFLCAKMVFVLLVLSGSMIHSKADTNYMSLSLLSGACFFASTVMYQVISRGKKVMFLMELLVVAVSLSWGFQHALYFGLVLLPDFLLLTGLPVYICLLQPIIIVALGQRFPEDVFLLLITSVAVGIIYYQEFGIIAKYRKEAEENYLQEFQLKHDMDAAREQHERQMKQSRLVYENEILAQKAEISQALHDKLGHSINGSLYQLEACKVIMDTSPQESKAILQMVIDHLRGSMDEIRLILRREKPEKSKVSVIQMEALCEECRTKYKIQADLIINGDVKRINDSLWEILLDNTYEAVSNALKYSNCKTLTIQLLILNEIVRCTIQDDGIGCHYVVDGMGLSGMKQRVRRAKGYLDVEAENGFKINMILPLKEAAS